MPRSEEGDPLIIVGRAGRALASEAHDYETPPLSMAELKRIWPEGVYTKGPDGDWLVVLSSAGFFLARFRKAGRKWVWG